MQYLLLAQDVVAAADGLPVWAKYALGPLGTLVLMGVYAYWTEKVRITKYQTVFDGLEMKLAHSQQKLEDFRDRCQQEKDGLRAAWDTKERVLEREVADWRDRHTKEKSLRAWYQAQAQSLADEHDDELKPPPDIDKTHYGESPSSSR